LQLQAFWAAGAEFWSIAAYRDCGFGSRERGLTLGLPDSPRPQIGNAIAYDFEIHMLRRAA
jgi:hypothetical protein